MKLAVLKRMRIITFRGNGCTKKGNKINEMTYDSSNWLHKNYMKEKKTIDLTETFRTYLQKKKERKKSSNSRPGKFVKLAV